MPTKEKCIVAGIIKAPIVKHQESDTIIDRSFRG
jgi:hypothetical protein